MISIPNLLFGRDRGIDEATDAYTLSDRMDRHSWHMEGIKELREVYRTEVGDARTCLLPEAQFVASVPWYVMTALMGRYGGELLADNAKLFFQWLDKHPEYKIAK